MGVNFEERDIGFKRDWMGKARFFYTDIYRRKVSKLVRMYSKLAALALSSMIRVD